MSSHPDDRPVRSKEFRQKAAERDETGHREQIRNDSQVPGSQCGPAHPPVIARTVAVAHHDRRGRRNSDHDHIDDIGQRQHHLMCCQAEHDLLRAMGAPVYDGLEETLKELNKRYPLFVVSNCQAGYIELVFEKTGLGKYFTGHLCPGDSGEAKAANIRSIAKKYQLKAPVYVGDTFGDYKACQEAGVPFVFASYGFGQVDTPDYVIEKPADLLKLF